MVAREFAIGKLACTYVAFSKKLLQEEWHICQVGYIAQQTFMAHFIFKPTSICMRRFLMENR